MDRADTNMDTTADGQPLPTHKPKQEGSAALHSATTTKTQEKLAGGDQAKHTEEPAHVPVDSSSTKQEGDQINVKIYYDGVFAFEVGVPKSCKVADVRTKISNYLAKKGAVVIKFHGPKVGAIDPDAEDENKLDVILGEGNRVDLKPEDKTGQGGKSRAEPAAGKRWFAKKCDMKFTSTIPIYIDHKGVLVAICSLITDRSEDNWGITIFDVPGAGKTTAIVEAAKKTNSGYIRLKAGTGILQAMVDAMDERVKTLADNITCSELEKNMKIVITSWLSKAISKCSTAIATTGELWVRLTGNGALQEADLEELKNQIVMLKAEIDRIDPSVAFVFHLEDVQAMSSPVGFSRAKKDALIPKGEYANYYLVCITSVFEDLRESFVWFKVAITGTNVFQDRIIRLASEWKNRKIDLGEIPPATTYEIINQFFDFDDFSQQEKEHILERISYNGRSIQYTLDFLNRTCANATTDEVPLAVIEREIDNAYKEWVGMLTNKLSGLASGTYKIMNQLLLLFLMPAAYGATVENAGMVSIPITNFPEQWAKYAECNILRAELADEKVKIFKFKGFLDTYMRNVLAQKVSQDDAMMLLVSAMSLAYEDIGSKGHLFERAIATEFSIPGSPLLQLLCSKIGDGFAPDPSSVLRPIKFMGTIADVADLEHRVHCVRDAAGDAGRVIDVAVPLQHHKLTPTYAITETGAVCEAKAGYKSSELWRLCNRFFQTDLRNFNKSPRVFISYEKFTDTEVAQYTTKGSVSGHDAREKVVELIKVAGFVVLEGADLDCSFLPVRKLTSLLLDEKNAAALALYPGELQNITADTFLNEFVPSVREAVQSGQPRKKLKTGHISRQDSMMDI